LSKDRKDNTEIELGPIGYARNEGTTENRTKLKSIERLLSNNKKLRLAYFN
jgi:hypothetical protein